MILVSIFIENPIFAVSCRQLETYVLYKIAPKPMYFDDSEAFRICNELCLCSLAGKLLCENPYFRRAERVPKRPREAALGDLSKELFGALRSPLELSEAFRALRTSPELSVPFRSSQELKGALRSKDQRSRLQAQGPMLKTQSATLKDQRARLKAQRSRTNAQDPKLNAQVPTIKIQRSRINALGARLNA